MARQYPFRVKESNGEFVVVVVVVVVVVAEEVDEEDVLLVGLAGPPIIEANVGKDWVDC